MGFKPPKSEDPHVLVDPCAGTGEAIATLRELWFGETRQFRRCDGYDAQVFAVELEHERFRSAKKRLVPKDPVYTSHWDLILEADAFHVEIQPGDGASLLFLNPPYDVDPVHGRLEQRFLDRWTQCLMPGAGVLMLLVPCHALTASAGFLACHFSHYRIWRFPDEDFAAFKQCVLLARRRVTPLPDNDIDRRRIEKWAEAPATLSVLQPLASPAFTVSGEHPGLLLEKLSLDLPGLLAGFRPWGASSLVGTDRSVHELIGAPYPVAMPPRPAHIALALSAGMLNGKRLTSSLPGLPPILVKGSFRRDYVVVEERTNKHGELTGTVQVQRPRLSLHALRLDTLSFHELRPGSLPSGASDFADFNSADLVAAYGESLGRLMRTQFPPLHDPARAEHEIDLPTLGRRPFKIQRQVIAAGLKLIAQGENPFLTAEVGTGKSTVSLAIAGSLSPEHFPHTVRELRRQGLDTSRLRPVRKTLIVCPPHLLKSWRDQAAAVLPTHRVQTVTTLADLDSPAEIYLLSREAAKLGHGVVGLQAAPGRKRQCPRCGALVTADSDALAAKRERCGSKRWLPGNPAARLAEDLAVVLAPSYPFHAAVRSLVVNRTLLYRTLPEPLDLEEGQEPPSFPPPATGKVESIVRAALRLYAADGTYAPSHLKRAIVILAHVARVSAQLAGEARILSAAMQARSEQAAAAGASSYADEVSNPRYLAGALMSLAHALTNPTEEAEAGHPLLAALEELRSLGTWDETAPCPEPLFQAVPSPRRFPVARYLLRRRKTLACNPDLLILDEVHEFSAQGSAQQKAAHRLVEIPGIPTLALSGSLMGGYAGSLFANFWALSHRFRRAFRRTEKQDFVSRYGYRKVFVAADHDGDFEIRGYGARTDREDQRESPAVRQMGEAPGLLPLFLLEHLLPVALLMHKEDLEGELPPCREIPVPIEIDPADETARSLLAENRRLLGVLSSRIRSDMHTKDAGKLWGAMGTLPSYLDRCTDDLPPFVLAYPEDAGGAVVAEGKLFPAAWRTPKERWVLNRVEAHLGEGRNVLIFLLHTGKSRLPDRYLRLFRDQLGERAVFLDVGKVKAADREDWLNKHVIEPERRILITNPKAVQTGLNNLVAFSRAIWVQGLDYDARVVRQANGRVHRIGQTLDVTIEVPYYQGTVQKVALDLVARKITASVQVDGLSIEGALESAGAGGGDDEASQAALGIGQAIYEAWVGR